MAMDRVAKSEAAPAFQQESFSEYHLYSLGRRTSIFDQESKQIGLLNATRFPMQKVYVVNGQSYYYRSVVQPGAPVKDPVCGMTVDPAAARGGCPAAPQLVI